MSTVIRVLPSELADQIAAGEVVERPASVVKELIENALDAGAKKIDIDVEGGGRRMIRVVDDGVGMTRDDAHLALKRHATSKLSSIADLFRLETMGFRGEALPSIAAVSRFTLTTRTRDVDAAWQIDVEGGHEASAREAGAPVGTQVMVRDLLWNIPARLKFLKGDPTEAAHITEAVTRLALAHPDVHLRLRHGGRLALDVPPHRSLLDRVQAVVGRRLASRLHPAEHEESGVRVTAFLAAPDEAQATARGVSLFVGRRFVRDRGLLHAVRMGYGELIPDGRHPTALIFIDPPEGTVDVNVHPQKIEVRFARAQEVQAAVRHAIAHAVARAPWLEERPRGTPVSMMTASSSVPAAGLTAIGASMAAETERMLFGWRPPGGPAIAHHVARAELDAEPMVPVPASSPGTARTFFGSLAYLGQLDRTYLLCEGEGELVLVDQHAAHERIAFQRLRAAWAANTPRTQRLLFPRTVALTLEQAAAAETHAAELAAIGFELTPLSGGALGLSAAPADLPDHEVERTLHEVLTDLGDARITRAVEDRLDAVFATVACHSVVRAGDTLAPAEARALLTGMDEVDFKAHCPHGRPVLLRISLAEIARRFGRT